MKKDKKQRKYRPMSDQEVRQLAEDMFKGLIFTDRNVQIKEDIPKVFVPLMLMGKEFINELQEIPVGMIYEYMDKAGPRSINAMPPRRPTWFSRSRRYCASGASWANSSEVVANV